MRIAERRLRRLIRSVILEGEKVDAVESKSFMGMGKLLTLNYGDVVELKDNKMANYYMEKVNPDFKKNKMLYLGSMYKVKRVYYLKGDENEVGNMMMFCELLDEYSQEVIKDVPCYANVLHIVERMKQLNDLKVGDKFILKDITQSDFSWRGKVDLQEMIGSFFKIIRIYKSRNFHGEAFNETRYAIVSPAKKSKKSKKHKTNNILFIIPLVDEFVEKLK
jgi:hypothetical protein